MSDMRMTLDQLRPDLRDQARAKIAERRIARRRKVQPAIRNRPQFIPKKANTAVERLKQHLNAEKISGWITEHSFHPKRGWRFDFAFPAQDTKLAVEIDGLTAKGGRHQRFEGYLEDCRKFSEALVLGWRVLRVTPSMVRSGEAIKYIKCALAMT